MKRDLKTPIGLILVLVGMSVILTHFDEVLSSVIATTIIYSFIGIGGLLFGMGLGDLRKNN